MEGGALHKDILRDNVRDAQGSPAAGNWACQLVIWAQILGLTALFDALGSIVFVAAEHRNRLTECAEALG